MVWSGQAEVFGYRRLGDYYHSLTIVAPEICREAKPGQFISIRLAEDSSLILRRPFSIHRVDRRPGWAGTIEIAFDIRGKGTALLARSRPHTVLDVLGPLGRPFQLPRQATRCLLVGGGIGAAPLLFLAEELRDRSNQVDFIVGGRSQEHLLRPIEAKRLAGTVRFTTDDGSAGHHGVVTDILPETVAQIGARIVYACGPQLMLRAVALACRRMRLPCQVAWEEVMACGFGACLVCAVPVHLGTDNSEAWTWVRCCVEGPVFSGSRIHWDMIGPPMAGAPA
jgi:dihydroorotate dehydrogenase electron transfer subunit